MLCEKSPLFHTTSRADVNGKGYDVFIIEDLPRLRQKLENYSDLVELNSKIKQWCQSYLQAFQARSNATTSHVIASQSDIVATSGSISNDLDSCNTRFASDTNNVATVYPVGEKHFAFKCCKHTERRFAT